MPAEPSLCNESQKRKEIIVNRLLTEAVITALLGPAHRYQVFGTQSPRRLVQNNGGISEMSVFYPFLPLNSLQLGSKGGVRVEGLTKRFPSNIRLRHSLDIGTDIDIG